MFLPIAHFDLDAFFASVEQKLNPRLRGKPVMVCGVDPQGRNVNRGVVATCSYEARKFGVKSGMPVYQARRLCPQGIFTKGHFEEYHKYSSLVFDIMYKFAPCVLRTNLDEGFLDFTGCETIYPDTKSLCENIRQEVRNKVGINISIGLANSRVVARIATKLAKPDGIVAITKSGEEKILRPLAIKFIPGIGPKTEISLNNIGIKTIGDLIKNKEEVIKKLGKHGLNLYLAATGQDNIWFEDRQSVKSIGRSTTFSKNSANINFILSVLFNLCDEVFYELFEKNLVAKCLSVNVRYPTFEDKQKSKTLDHPLEKTTDFQNQAQQLLFDIWDKTMALRLIGVKASNLIEKDHSTIFIDEKAKYDRLTKAISELRKKHGRDIITSAFTIDTSSPI